VINKPTFAGGKSHIVYMIEQVPWNKSSLLLGNILQNIQTLQLFTINIKPESIYTSFSTYQAVRL
jgi:hypothetical protein